jgi:hypothetical protein
MPFSPIPEPPGCPEMKRHSRLNANGTADSVNLRAGARRGDRDSGICLSQLRAMCVVYFRIQNYFAINRNSDPASIKIDMMR